MWRERPKQACRFHGHEIRMAAREVKKGIHGNRILPIIAPTIASTAGFGRTTKRSGAPFPPALLAFERKMKAVGKNGDSGV